MSRYLVYRWFTDPAQRAIYPPEDHDLRGRVFTVDLRAAYTADPAGTAGEIVEALLAVSPEFAEVWRRHEVDVTHHHELKRYLHPELGELEMYSWRLVDPDESQDLLVFMAEPGSPSEEKLQRLADRPAPGTRPSRAWRCQSTELSRDKLSVDKVGLHPVPGSRHA